MALLQVNDLFVSFKTRKGLVHALNGVSFTLDSGQTLCIVGESGSGKSVASMSILRLLDDNGQIDKGEIFFDDDGKKIELVRLPKSELCSIRGNKISVVFQEPMTALNPVFTIGRQLIEPLTLHRHLDKKSARIEGEKMLEKVKIPTPRRVMKQYAHQLSGGMRQRVMIAMALACKPKILIADEPTTALDVTIQAQILQLMQELQKESGTAILLITHDLGVVNETADFVAVMYCGQVVEYAPRVKIFSRSVYSHPYTEGLLLAMPEHGKAGERLECIEGSVPSPLNLPKGCKFAPRCKYCTQKCVENEPPLFEFSGGQKVRCFYAKKEERRSAEHEQLIIRRST